MTSSSIPVCLNILINFLKQQSTSKKKKHDKPNVVLVIFYILVLIMCFIDVSSRFILEYVFNRALWSFYFLYFLFLCHLLVGILNLFFCFIVFDF